MPDYSEVLKSRIQAQSITKIDQIADKKIDILLLDAHLDRAFSILTTEGLSNYTMPFRDTENNAPHVELCFALPSYWDLDFASENSVWVLEKIKFLAEFVINRETHFWDGHTIANANPNKPFSTTMKQDFLLFSKPLLYQEELGEITLAEKSITPLFLIPIFNKEFEHKLSRGVLSLKKKLVNHNVSEILDDYRTSSIQKRFGIF